MKKLALLLLSTALLGATSLHAADAAKKAEMCQMPKPTPQHTWLKRFVGNWKTVGEFYMEPGKPPLTTKGTEKFCQVGDFWVIGKTQSKMMGSPFTGVMTLGYDPKAKQYVGTWVDSMGSHLWNYTGTVDSTGNVLTLRSQGPCPMQPGKTIQFREVTQFVNAKKRIFTSYMLGDNGKWIPMFKITATR